MVKYVRWDFGRGAGWQKERAGSPDWSGFPAFCISRSNA